MQQCESGLNMEQMVLKTCIGALVNRCGTTKKTAPGWGMMTMNLWNGIVIPKWRNIF